MATTTNFGWETPDDTDLVKDGAAAIRTSLNGVDASFVDLKGGTTGQVLSKASGTDLDFTWVAQDDSNAIQNAIVDAKGDLIAATAADTPARLAVGTNGQVLTADSTASTGLAWATPASAGGQTLISTTTLSGSSTTISATLTSYKHVLMVLKMIQASGTTELRLRINADTGANYNTNIVRGIGTTANGRSVQNGTAFLIGTISTGSAVRSAMNGDLNLYRVNDTNEIAGNWHVRNDDGTDYVGAVGVGAYDCTAGISSFTFLLDSGTFSAGTVYLYGVN